MIQLQLKGQSTKARQLEKRIYNLNNEFKYDSSLQELKNFLTTPNISYDDKYFCNLYLSYTYKRLFDYPTTLIYLDSASNYGNKTNRKDLYAANIRYQRSLCFFDVQQYDKADSLMRQLASNRYQYLDEESKSKIFMQEAYLLFLKKNYSEAETGYKKAIVAMSNASPCDLPMIYAKEIELYGAMNNDSLMVYNYNLSLKKSDSCKITKYSLYANEMMAKAFEKQKDYKNAFFYYKRYENLTRIYNETNYLTKLNDLDKKYQTQKREQEITLQREVIKNKNGAIVYLIASLITVILFTLLFILLQARNKLLQEKKTAIKNTRRMLEKVEEERKRIASELHDSISHELLNLKSPSEGNIQSNNQKIDLIIDNIRIISRNLHPVLFERLGLQRSVEAMIDRVQKQNNFLLTLEIQYNASLSSSTELQLYRILQEAITNIIKHANAIAGKITILDQAKNVFIEIKDNGRGFNVNEKINSEQTFGLHNIIERTKAIGGEVKFLSNDTGSNIQIIVKK